MTSATDNETIKARIRKLMTYANCHSAMAGEIDTALKLAAQLMDAHHLAHEDINGPQDAQEQPISFSRHAVSSQKSSFALWEHTLAYAIDLLYGCTAHYTAIRKAPIRHNSIPKTDKNGNVLLGQQMMFYGPATEAQEASELFQEWSVLIATMGTLRWGGAFRGDGNAYCYGFAQALYEKAKEIHQSRHQLTAKPLPRLLTNGNANNITSTTTLSSTNSNAITLHARYSTLKTAGKQWLATTHGIRLSTVSSRSAPQGANSNNEAYAEGRAQGAAAGFSRPQTTPQRKRLS